MVAAGARVPAALVARCPWTGPSGIAALSSGRAGLPKSDRNREQEAGRA